MFIYIKEIKETIKVDDIESMRIDDDGDIRIETIDDVYYILGKYCDTDVEDRLIELVDKINNCYAIKAME